jgi:hypothetical protein
VQPGGAKVVVQVLWQPLRAAEDQPRQQTTRATRQPDDRVLGDRLAECRRLYLHLYRSVMGRIDQVGNEQGWVRIESARRH